MEGNILAAIWAFCGEEGGGGGKYVGKNVDECEGLLLNLYRERFRLKVKMHFFGGRTSPGPAEKA